MRLKWTIILLFLVGCTPPVYYHTTYNIDEFITDSNHIALGKPAILELTDQGQNDCLLEADHLFEEVIMDGDELMILLYCPRRPDRVRNLNWINETTGFRVCNGGICLPDLSFIEIENLTLQEVQEKVQAAYCDQLPDAQIFVHFKKRCGRQVQIIGAGHSLINLSEKTRLSEVLAKAQVPPGANLFKSYVMRKGRHLPIDFYKLIHEGDESQNIVMHSGDQIYIAAASDATIMVTGEVSQPLVVPVPYGFISLREALTMAGGIPFTGNKSCIQVIRGDLKRPKIYCLAWQDITHLPNQSLLLMPGDVVVISDQPITQWNRLIGQLQPSAVGMGNAYNVYQVIKTVTQ